MDNRMKDFYRTPPEILPQNIYLQDLSEQCAAFEDRVYTVMEKLKPGDREILKAYMELRDTLEVESVKAALRFGKK